MSAGQAGGVRIRRPDYASYAEAIKPEHRPDILLPIKENTALTVGKGDSVLVGQLVAVPLGKEMPVHASVSGTVTDILRHKGRDYIRIKDDGKYTPSPDIAPCVKRLSAMTTDEMIDRIRLCGIGAYRELSRMKTQAVRLIVNCVDEDPEASDRRCEVAANAKAAVQGCKILIKILGLHRCELAVEKKETDLINDLIDAIGRSELFDFLETDGKYPHGDADRLSVLPDPDNAVPDPDWCFVTDVHTAVAIYRAFSDGMPYVRRLISVGGDADVEKGCFDLPLGMPLTSLIPKDCTDEEPPEILIGGGLSGRRKGDLLSVDGSFSTVLYAVPSRLTLTRYACIGCRKCDDVCPEELLPSVFMKNRQKNFDAAYTDSGAAYCTDCGACTYVCPANIPIGDLLRETAPSPDLRKIGKKRKLTSSPFLHAGESVRSIQFDLLITLLILVGWASIVLSARVLLLCAIGAATAVLLEVLFNLAVGADPRSVLDLSGLCCGLMCALMLPPSSPLYLPAFAAFIAAVFVRGASGGIGKTPFHAAFLARVATELLFRRFFVSDGSERSLTDLLLGNHATVAGEGAVLILCGIGLYLILRRTINPWIPLGLLSTYTVVSFLLLPSGSDVPSAMCHAVLGSAVVFAAVYCGTEYSAIPKSSLCRAVYGVTAGGFGALISRFTSFEGVYIGILLSSLLTPLLDRLYTVGQSDAEERMEADLSPDSQSVVSGLYATDTVPTDVPDEPDVPDETDEPLPTDDSATLEIPVTAIPRQAEIRPSATDDEQGRPLTRAERDALLEAFAAASASDTATSSFPEEETAEETTGEPTIEDRLTSLLREVAPSSDDSKKDDADAASTALFNKLFAEADASSISDDEAGEITEHLTDED